VTGLKLTERMAEMGKVTGLFRSSFNVQVLMLTLLLLLLLLVLLPVLLLLLLLRLLRLLTLLLLPVLLQGFGSAGDLPFDWEPPAGHRACDTPLFIDAKPYVVILKYLSCCSCC